MGTEPYSFRNWAPSPVVDLFHTDAVTLEEAIMKRFRKESDSPSKGGRYVLSLRLWVLFAVVFWIFLPPPKHGFAACAPWAGGPCIDVTPPTGNSGERPERPERDSEGTGGGGCATMPTHEDSSGSSGNESSAPLPAGTPHAQHPNVIWGSDGQLHPAEGYTWAYPNDPRDFQVQLLPDGTPHPRYLNVVWDGNGLIRPANGFAWAIYPPGPDYKVVHKVVVANWSANWGTTDARVAVVALGGFDDAGLMNWMAANVMFGRYPDDGTSALSASGSTLKFKDRFFIASTSPAKRENLIAFEGGKVFYDRMKDMPLKGGGTLGGWFRGYYGGHTSIIEVMMDTKHGDEALPTTDLYDEYSRFAHVFRAQALQLHKPNGQHEQQEWDEVMREFQMHLDQVLPSR